ncbi:MAG: hypothetical protein U0174_24280 [Polyangiaceae bacterium]
MSAVAKERVDESPAQSEGGDERDRFSGSESIFLRPFSRLSDRTLVFVCGAILFVLAVWSQALVKFPPYQDLPDHLATVVVLQNPSLYPDFIPTGFVHTNSLLAATIFFGSKVFGLLGTARIFIVLTLAVTSWMLPACVLSFSDRRRMLISLPFMAPMIHNWWVAMGMLNFALGFPLSLALLMLQRKQLREFQMRRAVGVAICSTILWLTHSIPVTLAGALCAMEALRSRHAPHRFRMILRLLIPFTPTFVLVVYTSVTHAAGVHTPQAGSLELTWSIFRDSASVVYELWSCWFMQMSTWTSPTIVTALILGLLAIRYWRSDAPFFGSWTFPALAGIYFALPGHLPAFAYVAHRVVPYFWMAALLRLPRRLPLAVQLATCAIALATSVGTAVELVRGEADIEKFSSAAPYVADKARMFTLNFRIRVSSTNTEALSHASGMYVVAKRVTAQNVWADAVTMPIYRPTKPDYLDDPAAIRKLTDWSSTPADYCKLGKKMGLPTEQCRADWVKLWERIWEKVNVDRDYVLLWYPADELRQILPKQWTVAYENGPILLMKTNAPPR